MRFSRGWAALSLLLALRAPLGAASITVVHTNDIHGWIMPRAAAWNAADPQRQIGGAAALTAFYKKQPGLKVLLDAGDWFQGTPEGTLSRGQALVEVFNAIPYDAVGVGNHDFDMKESRLKELVAALKMPVLGANVYMGKDRKQVAYLTPSIVKNIGGIKVGIFGLLTTNMRNLTFPENFAGLEFRREIDEAKDAVAELKKRGATVIIAVTHMGFEAPDMAPFDGDKALAREVGGIDLIVGGHSHTLVRHPYREATHNTLIVQAGSYLSAAGKVVLDVDDKTGTVMASTGAVFDLWLDQWGEDHQVKAVVDKQAEAVRAIYDVVIATADAALTRNREGEASMGDWMTDCARAWSGADLAVQNGGGIRADLPRGPVTLRHIFNIMPFDNYMVKLDMDGGLVREVLDHGVNKTKGLIQISGASFKFDRDAPSGKRLSEVTVGRAALDERKLYKVVTIDFLVKGGDGYTPFDRAEKKEFTRVLMREVLNDCARESKIIVQPQGGRMLRAP